MSKYTISADAFLEIRRLRTMFTFDNGRAVLSMISVYPGLSEMSDDFLEHPGAFIEIYDNFSEPLIYKVKELSVKYLWLPKNYSVKPKTSFYSDKFNSIKLLDDGTFFIGLGDYNYHESTNHFYTQTEIGKRMDVSTLMRSRDGINWEEM